jgi:starch synthase (maltosyl-transferring)
VAFPESHDTPRLAMTLGDPAPAELTRQYRFHYLFAATFSTGVMMPMGFEYGCRKPLDVVGSRPGDWAWETDQPRIDLCAYIGAVNRMKAATPAFNVEGPQTPVTAPHQPIIGLRHLSGGDLAASDDVAIVLINPDPARAWGIDPGPLVNRSGGRISRFDEVTPERATSVFEPGRSIGLEPLSLRVFRGHVEARKPVGRITRAERDEAEQRLFALARNRVVIERVEPELDGGRHPIKRVVGDVVEVEADIFCDGHDTIAACIQYRAQDESTWHEAPMALVANDRWAGDFPVMRNRRYLYTIEAWRDLFASWRAEVMKKHDAGLDVALELSEGRIVLERSLEQARGADKKALAALLERLAAARVGARDEGSALAQHATQPRAPRRRRPVREPAIERDHQRILSEVARLVLRGSEPARQPDDVAIGRGRGVVAGCHRVESSESRRRSLLRSRWRMALQKRQAPRTVGSPPTRCSTDS